MPQRKYGKGWVNMVRKTPNDVEQEDSVAFVSKDGGWDDVRFFAAANDEQAEELAERWFPGLPWFVLNSLGNNINE